MTVRVPDSVRPACRCQDCILNPTESHGIHLIGAYRPRVFLPARGATLPAGVSYFMPYDANSSGGQGVTTGVFPGADRSHYTITV